MILGTAQGSLWHLVGPLTLPIRLGMEARALQNPLQTRKMNCGPQSDTVSGWMIPAARESPIDLSIASLSSFDRLYKWLDEKGAPGSKLISQSTVVRRQGQHLVLAEDLYDKLMHSWCHLLEILQPRCWPQPGKPNRQPSAGTGASSCLFCHHLIQEVCHIPQIQSH